MIYVALIASVGALIIVIASTESRDRRLGAIEKRIRALEAQAAQPVTVEFTPMDDPPREVLHIRRGFDQEEWD